MSLGIYYFLIGWRIVEIWRILKCKKETERKPDFVGVIEFVQRILLY